MNPKIKLQKKVLFLLLIDAVMFTISYAGAYLLRFDFVFPALQYLKFKNTLLPIILLKMCVFYYFGLYQGVWRYTGLKDLQNLLEATFTSSLTIVLLFQVTYTFQGFARSIFLIDSMFTVFLSGGFRLGIRIAFQEGIFFQRPNRKAPLRKKRVLIIGAGDAGEKILREIKDNLSLGYEVVGFLDDDPNKIYRYIHGVKVLDSIAGITALVGHLDLDEIIIAIPSVSEEKMRHIVSLGHKTGIRCRTVPGMGELLNGKFTVSTIRDISYADLLGRCPVELDMVRIGAYLRGKRVLVTGAGGSIGSECCRQIARFQPMSLIMLDRAESSLYDIEMEIKQLFPGQDFIPVLGSITSLGRLQRVFDRWKPQVVFHAAAYKHVPMMEMHPWEGIYNIILGTKNVLETAIEAGVERFVLISTDKAVRPTNIMGACKRVAEMIVQLKHKEMTKSKTLGVPVPTRIMAVRFGNVIGSAGSVIPLFKKQIESGGPVTVTHTQVSRYFMTINEAVQLVLQAGAMGESGEIYILKMGKPIKIIEMAKDLIRIFGLEPERDIPIKITGLRPGEKLQEELITEGEGIVSTPHQRLLVLQSNGHNGLVYDTLKARIRELVVLADRDNTEMIKLKLQTMVPEYIPYDSQEKIGFESRPVVKIIPKEAAPEIAPNYHPPRPAIPQVGRGVM